MQGGQHREDREALEAEAAEAHPISEHERHEIEAEGHDHGRMEREFQWRLLVSGALTIPVLVLSPAIQMLFGFEPPRFPGDRLLLLALASVIVFYGGWVFYEGAWRSLRSRTADMNVLVTVAVWSGYLFSAASLFFFPGADFFWEISTLVLVLLFGHWMEMRAVGATGYNVIALPLAAGVGVPVGIILAPQWGALAMAGSAVIVAVNASTLRTLKLGEKT